MSQYKLDKFPSKTRKITLKYAEEMLNFFNEMDT